MENKIPRNKLRGINIITSHWRRPVFRGFNLWIPACAGMTRFVVSHGELTPKKLKNNHHDSQHKHKRFCILFLNSLDFTGVPA